ncbi:MAG TPA: polymer-forming cytoskeletal protein [Candidatus Acidoferrales bacterium]|nr:polymer-forming cytoskeletal protein [Candidatus Acidoferrales bacterium]
MDIETQVVEEASMARGDRQASEISSNGHNSVMLGPRDLLQGKLTIEGDLRILGSVEGELRVSGDVFIESSATVQASIEARNINVRGQVNGNVVAKKRLVLAGSGRLNGDVRVGRLTVEDGATLNGNVATVASEKEKEKEPVGAHEGQG